MQAVMQMIQRIKGTSVLIECNVLRFYSSHIVGWKGHPEPVCADTSVQHRKYYMSCMKTSVTPD